jgi:hypothetical protein
VGRSFEAWWNYPNALVGSGRDEPIWVVIHM